jgi:hypothetical protein
LHRRIIYLNSQTGVVTRLHSYVHYCQLNIMFCVNTTKCLIVKLTFTKGVLSALSLYTVVPSGLLDGRSQSLQPSSKVSNFKTSTTCDITLEYRQWLTLLSDHDQQKQPGQSYLLSGQRAPQCRFREPLVLVATRSTSTWEPCGAGFAVTCLHV